MTLGNPLEGLRVEGLRGLLGSSVAGKADLLPRIVGGRSVLGEHTSLHDLPTTRRVGRPSSDILRVERRHPLSQLMFPWRTSMGQVLREFRAAILADMVPDRNGSPSADLQL